jgi:multidrug efflux pump subunit AcrA (membrane-fusion protein)
MSKYCIVAAALMAVALAGCDKTVQMAPEPRLVRTVTVEHGAEGEIVSLTGHVRPKDQASLAFRLDGRMIERPVNVGDVLKAGQVVAKLDFRTMRCAPRKPISPRSRRRSLRRALPSGGSSNS